MKRILVFLMIIAILITPISYVEAQEEVKSYLLADFETGDIFIEYNIDETISIASISKIMSYLVIMDAVKEKKISLNDRITIDKDTTKLTGSSFELKEGEVFRVQELLEASLIVSGNDATYAIAKHLSGSEEEFTKLMNKKARSLGLKTATFYNSTGLPIQGLKEQNQMSTRDLLTLTKHIIKRYPEVIDITNMKYISSLERGFFQRNTNPLLSLIDGVDGLKTGSTLKAGYCYVSTFNIKGVEGETEDLRLIAIIMGAKEAPQRNLKAKELVEYGMNNYAKKVFLDQETVLGTMDFPKGTIPKVDLYPKERFIKRVNAKDNIEVLISIDNNDLPIFKDSIVGKASVIEDGKTIFETDIIIKEEVLEAKWYEIFKRNILNFLKKMGNIILRNS